MTQAFHVDSVHSSRFFWQISLLLFVFCGCGLHNEDEDHHLEHLIPAHKPTSFAKAIPELSQRGPAVLKGQASDELRQQLLNIIDWLPELAAESDLKRRHWEQVRDTGLELRKIATNHSNDSQSRWQELIEELRSLVSDSDTLSPQVTTEHTSAATSNEEIAAPQEHSAEVHHD